MRIGVDFDGVVTDVASLMVAHAAEHLRVALDPAHIVPPAGPEVLGAEVYQRLLDETHATPLSLRAEPLPDAVETLARLGAEHEIVVVTARYGEAVGFAEQWLEQHGLGAVIEGVVSSHGAPKSAVARPLGLAMLIDDVPDNLAGLDAGMRGVLMTAAHNEVFEIAAPFVRVRHWREIEALVAREKTS